MHGYLRLWLTRVLDHFLPISAFPRDDHRRRMQASFVLALGMLQFVGSLLIGTIEFLAGHYLVACLLWLGALLPWWPGTRMRDDGNVERWGQVFIANMFGLLSFILLASGGRAVGIVVAFPALLLIASLVSRPRQIILWGAVVTSVLLVSNVLRNMPGQWLVDIDLQWAMQAVDRIPVVLTLCFLGIAVLLRMLLESVFDDLTRSRDGERQALQRANFDQQRFVDFADIAADWFWETDARLRLIYVSPGFTSHTGLRPEQVLGLHPVAIVQHHQPEGPEVRVLQSKMARGESFDDERMAWRDASGHLSIFRVAGRPLRAADQALLGYRGAVTNITETWRLNRELERLARTDPLTGLLNRRAFGQALTRALEQTRDESRAWWLLQLDLDHFKAVNDSAGHAMGDRVLLRVAELLRESGLPPDALARIGGDEFAALICEPDAEAVSDYANLILAGFARFQSEFGRTVGASIGICRVRADLGDESAQLQAVDEACYRAKHQGRGRVVVA